MQKPNNNSSKGGVVQWVTPPSSKLNQKENSTDKNTIEQNGCNKHNNYNQRTANNFQRHYSTSTRSSISSTSSLYIPNEKGIFNHGYQQKQQTTNPSTTTKTTQPPVIDLLTCRTICSLVDEHLRELNEHQMLIDKARSNLICSQTNNNSQQAEFCDITYIARNDTFKLKVRDEQTRAIETIKQLTNYLRELSLIEKQYNNSTSNNNNDEIIIRDSKHKTFQTDHSKAIVNEEIITKLSDLRSEIIQALNNFVLSNSDIDVPIIDIDDINKYDYDLCIDAKQTSSLENKKKFSDLSSSNNSSSVLTSASGGSTVNSSNQKYSSNNYNNNNNPTKTPLIVLNNNIDNIKQLDEYSTNSTTLIKSTSIGTLLDQQQNSPTNRANLEKRSRELQKLERDTLELRRLFSDFYNLVRAQGEQVDTIEDNIVIATHRISEGQHNLNRSMKGLTIIIPVTGCMAGALIGGPLGLIIGGKLGGITIGCATSLLGLLSSYSAQRCITFNKLKHD